MTSSSEMSPALRMRNSVEHTLLARVPPWRIGGGRSACPVGVGRRCAVHAIAGMSAVSGMTDTAAGPVRLMRLPHAAWPHSVLPDADWPDADWLHADWLHEQAHARQVLRNPVMTMYGGACPPDRK